MSVLDTKRKRDIRRQRGQFVAVAVTIGLGVMLFASTYDAYLNLDDSYNRTYDRLNFADVTVVGAEPGFEDTARTLGGVESVETRLEADLPFKVGDEVFIGRVIGYPSDGQPVVNAIDVHEGSYLDPTDSSKAVIEAHMATQFELDVGDSFEVSVAGQFTQFEVAGIAVSSEYIWPARSRQEIFPAPGTFGVAFVDEALLEEVPPSLTDPDVLITYVDGSNETDLQVAEAARGAGAGDVIPRAEHPSNETLQLDVEGFQELAFMFPALFMAAAWLASFVLLTRLVIAQRSQIGTMRASGMRRGRILRHYLSYGTRLGFVAGAIGVGVGVALGAAITALYTQSLGIPDTIRGFHWVTPIVGLAFGLVAGALGAYAPARRAFRLSPAEAMRGNVPASRASRSLIETLVPPLRRLPVRWLLALRGIGRNRRRSMSTIVGVGLAVILVMVSWGMIDSMRWLIDRQFNVVATEDADIVLSVPATNDAVSQIRRLEGVTRAEVSSSLEATVRVNGESYKTTLQSYPADSQVHSFPDGLPASGFLAGKALADEIGVEVGDTVTIGLGTVDARFEAELKGFLDEPMGTFLYAERGFLEDQLDDPSVLIQPGAAVVKAGFDADADREAVIEEIKKLDVVVGVVDARVLVNLINDFVGFFYAFVGVMLLLGGAMAFAMMFNTISVNVAERSGEFATMRANGLSHAGIARVIAFENMLLTLLGAVPAVIVGWIVGVYFLESYSSDMFTLEFRMEPLSIVFLVVVMLVTAGLSLIPALRTVRRLQIGEVVRERAA